MVFHYWHLVVPVALGALVLWGFRVARRATLIGLAVTLVAASGFLLHTLVLDEPYLEHDLSSRMEDLALIGTPGILGIAFCLLAVKELRGRRS